MAKKLRIPDSPRKVKIEVDLPFNPAEARAIYAFIQFHKARGTLGVMIEALAQCNICELRDAIEAGEFEEPENVDWYGYAPRRKEAAEPQEKTLQNNE